MGCPDENVIAELLSGRLPPDARRGVEQHVDRCGDCATLISELARMGGPAHASLATATSDAPPPAIATAYRAAPTLSGQVIGRYHVERTIGAGGMGVVYAAVDPVLGRRVALKLLRPDAMGGEDIAYANARLLREARAMAALAHPNVVPVFDAGALGDRVYLAMELVEGQTLVEWLRSGRRGWREVMKAFLGAGAGLAAAHAAGLVHRDFKPANVLMGVDGRARVTDFGLVSQGAWQARAASPIANDVALDPATVAGALVGTPTYMAPEQLFLQPVDARADQFAFCFALYEALYGAPPFDGSTIAERRWVFASRRARFPADHRGAPREVAEALLRGLGTRPEERYPSMAELLAALERAMSRGDELHLRVNALSQFAAGLLHLAFLWVWWGYFNGPASPVEPATAGASGSGSGLVAFGAVMIVVLLLVLAWAFAGVVWAPLNAVGLLLRWPFARRSALIYAAISALSCVGLPYGVYAIWSLRREGVREMFRKRG